MNSTTTTSYIIQYGNVALDLNSTQVLTLLALIHYREMNGYTNVCNPTYARLALANGQKNLKKITPIIDVLEGRGYITRKTYSDESTKKSRNQYTIHDDVIIEACKKIESEWYSKFEKQDEETEEQAFKIANPELFTEQEVTAAITPPPKPIPEGKQKNPATGRVVNRYEPEKPKGRAVSVMDAWAAAEATEKQKRLDAPVISYQSYELEPGDIGFEYQSTEDECPW